MAGRKDADAFLLPEVDGPVVSTGPEGRFVGSARLLPGSGQAGKNSQQKIPPFSMIVHHIYLEVRISLRKNGVDATQYFWPGLLMSAVYISYVCLSEMLDGLLSITGFHDLFRQRLLVTPFIP